jgi:hypothetical protein
MGAPRDMQGRTSAAKRRMRERGRTDFHERCVERTRLGYGTGTVTVALAIALLPAASVAE